jgi:hypothetical protein
MTFQPRIEYLSLRKCHPLRLLRLVLHIKETPNPQTIVVLLDRVRLLSRRHSIVIKRLLHRSRRRHRHHPTVKAFPVNDAHGPTRLFRQIPVKARLTFWTMILSCHLWKVVNQLLPRWHRSLAHPLPLPRRTKGHQSACQRDERAVK